MKPILEPWKEIETRKNIKSSLPNNAETHKSHPPKDGISIDCPASGNSFIGGVCLDGTWKFLEDPKNVGLSRQWYGEIDDSSWSEISVPGTWGWDGYAYKYYEGYGWYRKRFFAPYEWENKFIRLLFKAVHHSANIWINGSYVGSHEGGFTPFSFDVSQNLIYGGNNLLVVRVNNSLSGSTIPPANAADGVGLYGGIHRAVYLKTSNNLTIERVLVLPDYSPGENECIVNVDVTIFNRYDLPKAIEIKMAITNPDSTDRPLRFYHIEVPPGVSKHSFQYSIDDPKPWWCCDIGDPNLYLLEVSLIQDNEKVDSMITKFGIRDIENRPDGLYLNGVKLVLKGVNRHEFWLGLGWTENESIIKEDFNSIRELRANFVRLAHYPQDERVLEYCDTNGILVYEEIPVFQCLKPTLEDPSAIESAKAQLTELILRDYNHPSVILWGLGNEFRSDTSEGKNFISILYKHVKSIDHTRPVTFATDKHMSDKGLDIVDIIAINEYFGLLYGKTSDLSELLDALHQTYSDKPILVTEFGSDVASLRDRAAYIQDHWRIIRSKDFVIGGAVWVYNEYIWREPARNTWGIDQFGIVDKNRNPKPICYSTIQEMFASSQKK